MFLPFPWTVSDIIQALVLLLQVTRTLPQHCLISPSGLLAMLLSHIYLDFQANSRSTEYHKSNVRTMYKRSHWEQCRK